MKIIFMGTPDFSVGTFEALIQAGHQIVLVVTQPDKPQGRKHVLAGPPMKEAALAHGIEVFQPKRVRKSENVEYLRSFGADLIVVVAFGQILPKSILEMPKYGCINVHASLLPKYRGASPIQWAVLNGEKETGVTVMKMDEGLDTGDMILVEKVTLDEKETGGSLFERLQVVGASACVKAVSQIENGTATYTQQDHEQATKTGLIEKSFGFLNFSKSAEELERIIRGLNPWPSAYTRINGKMLKIWSANTISQEEYDGEYYGPGHICEIGKQTFKIECFEGVLEVVEVQLEGKRRMNAGDFLRGNQIELGMELGLLED